jgi:rod shape-determining protein MreC
VEVVLSSGLGGIFPKGLRIGTVSKVVKQDYGLFQEVEVAPSVDFSKLEEVLIIYRDNLLTEQ